MVEIQENLNELISSILKDLRYMCTQAIEKSNLLLEETENQENVSKKLHTLIHRMRINLDTWEDQLYKTEAEYDRNVKDSNIQLACANKKKINLSLKKIGDTQETDIEEPKVTNQLLQNANVEVDSQQTITYTQPDSDEIKIEEHSLTEKNATLDEPNNLSNFDFDCGVDDFKLLNREDENFAAQLLEKSQQENNELLALLKANINDTQIFDDPNKSKENILENLNDDDSINSSDLHFSDSGSDISDLSEIINSDVDGGGDTDDEKSDNVENVESFINNQDNIINNQPTICLKPLDQCTDKEIDRLCDLNSVNKRKCKKALKSVRKRPKRVRILSTSSESSNSSSDLSLSGTAAAHIPVNTDYQPDEANELDDILANFLGDDNSSNDETNDFNIDDIMSDSDDDTQKEKPAKKSKKVEIEEEKQENIIEINDDDDDEATLQEKRRSLAWKSDRLLKDHIWTSSDGDSSDSNGGPSSSTAKHIKQENSSQHNGQQKNRNVGESMIISDSDNDSDSDDCRFVNEYEDDPGGAGRRNIRAIMTEDELDKATIKANREEDERVKRVETLSQTLEELQTQHSDFILDVDATTGKPLITVDAGIARTLKPHQTAGIRFMWEACFESVQAIKTAKSGTGCILAHCMGLGKTRQVISLIHTLFFNEITQTRHVLIICPLSTVSNWWNEFSLVFSDQERQCTVKTVFLIKQDMDEKIRLVKKWRSQKGVLVMGYEAFERLTSSKLVDKYKYDIKRIDEALLDPGPDLIVCDEGHLLKNGETRRTKALMRVKTKRRIVLTGTPLQNNLMEYYFMVHFVKPHLLGTCKEYKNRFANPILNGQYHDSGLEDIKIMKKRTHVLSKLLKRTIQRVESKTLAEYLPEIIDYTIYITLNSFQVALYQKYIEIVTGKAEKLTRMGFFHDFRITNFICLHPYVLNLYYNNSLKSKKIKEVETVSTNFDNIDKEVNSIVHDWYRELLPEDIASSLEYSTKFKIMMAVIDEAVRNEEKVLIFAHYLVELDAVEHFLQSLGTPSQSKWKSNEDYFRMDGTIKPERRSELCLEFNRNPRVKIFLISHKVGGLGLNLTAANRVVLIGTHYNPAHDTQSIYRAYRFGQTKPCFVYRLLTKGTMEEKIYQKCVVKLAVAGTVVDKLHLDRHYNSNDLRQMYQFDYSQFAERPQLNRPNDTLLASLIEQHVDIYSYLEHNSLLENKPDEELDDEDKKLAWEDFIKTKNNKTEKTIVIPPQLVPNPLAKMGQFMGSRAQALLPQRVVTTSMNDRGRALPQRISTNDRGPCIDLTSNSVISGRPTPTSNRQEWNNLMVEPRPINASGYKRQIEAIKNRIREN